MDTPKDILIAGLGISGEATARYFLTLPTAESPGRVIVLDGNDTPVLRERKERLEELGADVRLSTEELAERVDLAVISPGLAPGSPLYECAQESAEETIGEIELAYRVSHAPWVAVTGTNGKTTVTSLVAHVLRSAGMIAEAVGNIGVPAIEVVRDTSSSSVIVAEVSSFQLHSVEEFHPRVAVLLNITPDHVDWHGSMESYIADKSRIFKRMGRLDTAVVDVDDLAADEVATELSQTEVGLVTVRRSRPPEGGAGLVDGMLVLDHDGREIELCKADELQIKGEHNISNALAAAAAAHACGADRDAIRAGLMSFEPIEHRLEPAGEVDGVEYYNDSKATNVDAVLKALTAFSDRNVVLLVGGRAKGTSFDALAQAASGMSVVAFGEAGPEIACAFQATETEPMLATSLAEAVKKARSIARPGDVILLSPACASFDEFANYRERGRAFKTLVVSAGGDST